MKNITKAQAANKIREAMSGLRDAIKTATPQERQVIKACMSELRDIEDELLTEEAALEDPAPAVPAAEEPTLPTEEAALDDLDLDLDLADLDDEELFEDSPLEVLDEDDAFDDEDLALSALELAASALRAAQEDEEEEKLPSGAEAAEAALEDKTPATEAIEETNEAPEGGDPTDTPVEEAAMDDESADASDPDEDGPEEDSEEILSDEEIAALEAEGLVEGRVQRRIQAIQARLHRLVAAEDAAAAAPPAATPTAPSAPAPEADGIGDVQDAEAMPSTYEEDSEEVLTMAEYNEVLAALSPEERRELRLLEVSGSEISARKMAKSDFRKMKKTAVKNRKLRKFRGPMLKSQKGRKASVMTPSGKRKVIRKRFYHSSYDTKGNFLGTFWYAKKDPNKETMEAYKKKHGVKHPAALPKVDPKKKWGAARKKKAAAKK